MHNELFFRDKIISELSSGRGVRIGESSIASTKLHLINAGIGEIIVQKSKDLGKCLYGEKYADAYIHIDTFHSAGNVSGSEVSARLKEIFASGIEIIAGNSNHVHTALKLPPEKYGLIIPAVRIVEELILSQGMTLKKVKSLRSRRYLFYSSFFVFKSKKGLFGGEFSDTPLRMSAVGKGDGALAFGGTKIRNKGKSLIEDRDKIRKIIRYLRENSCLIKEETVGIKDERDKIAGILHKDDWIENIDINGTAVSLLRKKYWTGCNCEIEEKDIKVYNYSIKNCRDTIFIIDNSQSMKGDNIESAKRVVSEICRRLKGRAAIVTFSGSKAYLYSRFTNNKETIGRLIDNIDIQEVTPLAHGLNVAYEYAARSLRKDVNIVLLTDGEPNVPLRGDCPLTDCIEVSAQIRRKGYKLCCICTTGETSAVEKIIEAAKGKIFSIDSLKAES